MAYSPIPELNSLHALQEQVGGRFLAQGFEFGTFNDQVGLYRGNSKDPDFLAALTVIAQATGTGSEYALWRVDGRDDLATLPVVVFGDEGGQHVVARDLRELFQLLAVDSEPMVDWDGVVYYVPDDHEPSTAHDEYLEWLAGLGLSAPDDADALVAAAQAEYGAAFTAFCARYMR